MMIMGTATGMTMDTITIIMAMNITVTTMISGICRVGKGAHQTCDLRHQIDAAPCPRVGGSCEPHRTRVGTARMQATRIEARPRSRAFAHPTPLSRFARRLPCGSFR